MRRPLLKRSRSSPSYSRLLTRPRKLSRLLTGCPNSQASNSRWFTPRDMMVTVLVVGPSVGRRPDVAVPRAGHPAVVAVAAPSASHRRLVEAPRNGVPRADVGAAERAVAVRCNDTTTLKTRNRFNCTLLYNIYFVAPQKTRPHQRTSFLDQWAPHLAEQERCKPLQHRRSRRYQYII